MTWFAFAVEYLKGQPFRVLGVTELEPGTPEILIDYIDETGEIDSLRIFRGPDLVREIPVEMIVLQGEEYRLELETGFWEDIL
ncbi:MAG: hypothetical protein AMS19_02470 [Gemmatimonas sp. SG8_23]|nr:MAG: hypothetical protein AMS19_02470 [Gemmatimonas sp. SG8_23]